MANVYATKTGNWSDTTVWNTGSLPTASDDVFSNNFTVTVNQDIRVLTLQNNSATGINAGGGFRTSTTGAVSISADVIGRGNVLTIQDACSATLVGNVSGSPTVSNVSTVSVGGFSVLSPYLASYATLYFFGSAFGGSVVGSEGIRLNAGRLYVTGAIIGGTASTAAKGVDVYNSVNVPTYVQVNSGSVIRGGSSANGSTPGLQIEYTPTGTAFDNSAVIIYCDVEGGSSQGSNPGIATSSRIPITIYGNCRGSGIAAALSVTGTSTIVNIIGNCFGFSNGGGGVACPSSTAVINITGNCYGGFSTNGYGLVITNPSSAYIVGDVYGGIGQNSWGVANNSTGYVSIVGRCIGGLGSTSYGAANTSTGVLCAKTAVGNGYGLFNYNVMYSVPGIFGAQNSKTILMGLEIGPRGQWPTAGNIFMMSSNTSQALFEKDDFTGYTLYTDIPIDLLPSPTDVRKNTVYGPTSFTGSIDIPAPSDVALKVSVDSTVGNASILPENVWNSQISSNSSGFGFRLSNSATIETTGNIVASYNI